MPSEETQKIVLKKYCKYIVHMRQQFSYEPKRFGIVFGAGISKDFGFPSWEQLVSGIAKSDAMNTIPFCAEKDDIKNAQKLFQGYKAHCLSSASFSDGEYNRTEMKIRSEWQRVVHNVLYNKIAEDIDNSVPDDHYLRSFIALIKKIPMTVNYNFDDTIQRLLAKARTEDEKKNTRGYTTVWNTNVYMYPKNCVIYHPNGFLPYNISEHPSEQLVFLEDSFADQLIDSLNGNYSVLSNYFSQNTCLLVGLSLADPTLKHTLRINSQRLPGQFHYYIKHLKEGEILADERAIIDANFEVYNLITLFLTSAEIKALAELISMESDDFRRLAERVGAETIYKYYLVGSVAVGKSTALSNFRSLATQDEWLESMPPDMAKDPSKVDDPDIDYIDKWVAEQWGKKNYRLLHCPPGIHMIDRAPLDAFAFTDIEVELWKKKAELLICGIRPDASSTELVPAHVILMIGDPHIMSARAIANHRDTDADKLRRQQELLIYTYTKGSTGEGVTILDTKNKTKNQVAKDIARIIYLNDYTPAPLEVWLKKYASGEFPPPPLV